MPCSTWLAWIYHALSNLPHRGLQTCSWLSSHFRQLILSGTLKALSLPLMRLPPPTRLLLACWRFSSCAEWFGYERHTRDECKCRRHQHSSEVPWLSWLHASISSGAFHTQEIYVDLLPSDCRICLRSLWLSCPKSSAPWSTTFRLHKTCSLRGLNSNFCLRSKALSHLLQWHKIPNQDRQGEGWCRCEHQMV